MTSKEKYLDLIDDIRCEISCEYIHASIFYEIDEKLKELEKYFHQQTQPYKLEPDSMIPLTNDQRQTLLKLVVKFQEAQIIKCVEEMSELTKELCKFVINRSVNKTISEENMDNISEEIADVYIMLEQIVMYFGNKEDVEKIINEKIERTRKRLLEEK